ncbi:hypothetical protein PilKf_01294 [Pillotina sp. SPG140]|jgi:Arc/MetJ-type ribon-helix-helix transcriptional regulator
MKKVALERVENEYKQWIEKKYNNGQFSNVDELIHVSLALFHEIKVEGIDNDSDGDMFLFQYGIYD